MRERGLPCLLTCTIKASFARRHRGALPAIVLGDKGLNRRGCAQSCVYQEGILLCCVPQQGPLLSPPQTAWHRRSGGDRPGDLARYFRQRARCVLVPGRPRRLAPTEAGWTSTPTVERMHGIQDGGPFVLLQPYSVTLSPLHKSLIFSRMLNQHFKTMFYLKAHADPVDKTIVSVSPGLNMCFRYNLKNTSIAFVFWNQYASVGWQHNRD